MDAHDDLPLPLDVIYHCHVCHSIISDIYHGSSGDKGFRDAGYDRSEQLVTKLWLTECMHLTCSEHFEGRGIPLHPSGQTPLAPCPVCILEKADHTKRSLYGIRGYSEQEHDSLIPACWFNTPPSPLPSDGGAGDALRFQYISLVRYATNAYAVLKTLRLKIERLAKKYDKAKADRGVMEERQHVQEERLKRLAAENARLQESIAFKTEELQSAHEKLQTWADREPKIMYYLGLFKDVVRENTQLKARSSQHQQLEDLATVDATLGHGPETQDSLPAMHDNTVIGTTKREKSQSLVSRMGSMDPRQPSRQHTASSRTLSGQHTHVEKSSRGLRSPSQRLFFNQTSTLQPGAASKNILRERSFDSNVLMPPPPRPREQLDSHIWRASSQPHSTAHHTFEGANQSDRIERTARGSSLLESDIVLRQDGTWALAYELDQSSKNSARSSDARPAFSDGQKLHTAAYVPREDASFGKAFEEQRQPESPGVAQRTPIPTNSVKRTSSGIKDYPLFLGQQPSLRKAQSWSRETDDYGIHGAAAALNQCLEAEARDKTSGPKVDMPQNDPHGIARSQRPTGQSKLPWVQRGPADRKTLSIPAVGTSHSTQSPASPFFNPHAARHPHARVSLPMRSRSSSRAQHSASFSSLRPAQEASFAPKASSQHHVSSRAYHSGQIEAQLSSPGASHASPGASHEARVFARQPYSRLGTRLPIESQSATPLYNRPDPRVPQSAQQFRGDRTISPRLRDVHLGDYLEGRL